MLEDKVALITGAGSGIGFACARVFSGAGAHLMLVDRNYEQEQERELLQLLEKGGKVVLQRCDIRDERGLVAAVKAGVKELGRIDVVIANAGINGLWAPIEKYSIEAFDELVATNIRGTFLTIRSAVPYLKRSGGTVVVIGSVNGSRTYYHGGSSIYCATKAAVTAMAKAFAIELARDNIRVNVVAPGKVKTRINEYMHIIDGDKTDIGLRFVNGNPMINGGEFSAEDVANTCLFLCSGPGQRISGTEIYLDGAQSLIA